MDTDMRGLMLSSLIIFVGCADSRLPVLSVPLSDNTTFGTDLNATEHVFGITVTDPLNRMNR